MTEKASAGSQAERKLKQLLQFERLVSEISNQFINLPAKNVDDEIARTLQQLVKFLKFDRSSIMRFSSDLKTLTVTHTYAHPGVETLDGLVMSDMFPWYTDQMRKGEPFTFHKMFDETPESAVPEREYIARIGMKSNLSTPLKAKGSLMGAITFGSFRKHVSWPDDLIQRLKLIGEIVANALLQKQAEEGLQEAFRKIEQLREQLKADNRYLRDEIKAERNFDNFIGESDPIKYVHYKTRQIAQTDTTTLIQGETGTGKELVARAIHDASLRNRRPLIKVDCASLTSTLIDSQLFGHERGAFTDARTREIGRFELGDNSTVFLDEIGELPPALQAKLLRIIEYGEFERLGSSRTIKVDVRIIAATNRDLEAEVRAGRFREDLWYRLNVFPITVPPLRDRIEDIPLLVDWFVQRISRKMGKHITKIPSSEMKALQAYHWPGNVRELANVIERAVITTGNSTLFLADKLDPPEPHAAEENQGQTLTEVERAHILRMLQDYNWRVEGPEGVAGILGLNPSTLRSRMRKLGIEKPPIQL